MSSILSRRPALLVGLCILVSALAGTLLGRVTLSDAAIGTGERAVVVTVTPFRLLDTRPAPYGPIGVTTAAPFVGGAINTVQVTGVGGVPADATGVLLNTTALNCTNDSFITVWPDGAPRPNTSSLNPVPDRITFNSSTTDLGASGKLAIFVNAGTCDVIVDVSGYAVDHNHDDRYVGSGGGALRVFSSAFVAGTAPAVLSSTGAAPTVTRTAPGQYLVAFQTSFLADPTSFHAYVNVTSASPVYSCSWTFNGGDMKSFFVFCRDHAGTATDSSFSYTLSIPGSTGLVAPALDQVAPDESSGK